MVFGGGQHGLDDLPDYGYEKPICFLPLARIGARAGRRRKPSDHVEFCGMQKDKSEENS